MISNSAPLRISAPGRLPHPISLHANESLGAAYIVTADRQLGSDVRTFIQAKGIRTEYFVSGAGYMACKRAQAASCLLIGSQLSDMSGLDLQRILANTSAPPIIFLSQERDISACVRAIREGAHDFLTLPLMASRLLEAVDAAIQKDRTTIAVRQECDNLRKRWHSLTSREAEVMRYVVAGFLNKQTAAELNITENTVQVHRGRVMRKMRADSFAELVRMSLILAHWGEQTFLLSLGSELWQGVPACR